jgi:hypothetical protein
LTRSGDDLISRTSLTSNDAYFVSAIVTYSKGNAPI